MNDSDQRARYNRSAMQRNEDWYCNPPEDREYEREQREDIQAQKEEWEWECKRDAELTDPKEKIEVKDSYDWRKPETPEEKEEREWREWFRRDEERHFNRQWT